MRDELEAVLRTIHDRIFEGWIYEVPKGRLEGIKRRGRPTWLRRQSEDPRLERELEFLDGLPLGGAVAYDVGANLGAHSLLLHRLVGDGEVHVFEPDPFYRKKLLDLVVLNELERFEVHGVALGAHAGRETLLVPDGSKVRMAGTLARELQARVSPENTKRTTAIRVTTLDAYRAALDLSAPDFLKIDVEGFERQVLEGAMQTLTAHRPTIMVEIHGATDDAKRQTTQDIVLRLAPLGYTFVHLESGEPIDAAAPPVGGHVIARTS